MNSNWVEARERNNWRSNYQFNKTWKVRSTLCGSKHKTYINFVSIGGFIWKFTWTFASLDQNTNKNKYDKQLFAWFIGKHLDFCNFIYEQACDKDGIMKSKNTYIYTLPIRTSQLWNTELDWTANSSLRLKNYKLFW